MPAVTRNRFGKGAAWYIATDPETKFVEGLVAHLCAEHGIEPVLAPIDGVEVTQRKNGDKSLTFLLNHNADPVTVDVTPVAGRDLLSGRQMSGPAELPGRGVWIIEKGG